MAVIKTAIITRLLVTFALSSSERLQYLNLDSLTCSRVKAELIMCYKVLHCRVELRNLLCKFDISLDKTVDIVGLQIER